MNWISFSIIAVLVVIAGGFLGGWLLPMTGLARPLARIIGFGIAGGIIAALYVRMNARPS